MKSPEQRLSDVTEELRRRLRFGTPPVEELARAVLEAADREPPTWPTDESLAFVIAETSPGREAMHRYLRAAFLADPIIRAAVAYRDGNVGRRGDLVGGFGQTLIDAVNESGL